jgi:hypothetical protein
MDEGKDIGRTERVSDNEEHEEEKNHAHSVAAGRHLTHALVQNSDLLLSHLVQTLLNPIGIHTELGELFTQLVAFEGAGQFAPQVAGLGIKQLVIVDHSGLGHSERCQEQGKGEEAG